LARTAKKPTVAAVVPIGTGVIEPTDDGTTEGPWRDRVVSRSLGAKRRQSIDRGAAFVAAAMEILREEGESLTVQDVADRAGFSLRILYRHFASKDDLLAAVLEEILFAAAKQMRTELYKIDDPVERLATFISGLIDNERSAFNIALTKHELLLMTVRPEEVGRAHAPVAQLGVELVSAVVDTGKVPAVRPEDVVSLIFNTTRSYNHSKLLGDTSGLSITPPAQTTVVAYCMGGIGLAVPERP
jgi:AcrR family transcriptional regulator